MKQVQLSSTTATTNTTAERRRANKRSSSLSTPQPIKKQAVSLPQFDFQGSFAKGSTIQRQNLDNSLNNSNNNNGNGNGQALKFSSGSTFLSQTSHNGFAIIRQGDNPSKTGRNVGNFNTTTHSDSTVNTAHSTTNISSTTRSAAINGRQGPQARFAPNGTTEPTTTTTRTRMHRSTKDFQHITSRINPFGGRRRKKNRLLNRELVEEETALSEPSEVLELFLSDKNIVDIDDNFASEFENVYLLELGDNIRLPIWKLRKMKQLKELHVPCNGLDHLVFHESAFQDDDQDFNVPTQVYSSGDLYQQENGIANGQPQHTNALYSMTNQSHQALSHQLVQQHHSLEPSIDEPLQDESAQNTEFPQNTHTQENNYDESGLDHSNRLGEEQHTQVPTTIHGSAIAQYPTTNTDNEVVFPLLETLNLSFNNLHTDIFGTLYQLSLLPSLKKLNLSSNDLTFLPDDLSALSQLVFLSLEGNKLDERVFLSLSTIPHLEKLNLSKNKIRRIPQLTTPSDDIDDPEEPIHHFPCLTMLNMGENHISFHQDLYNLIHFSCLKQVFVWGNPICDSSKELESAAYELEEKQIQIVLNGPVPPPTKDLSVKNFYAHKMKTIKSYEYVTRQKKEVVPVMNDTQSEGSSFFITETRTIESDSNSTFSEPTTYRSGGGLSLTGTQAQLSSQPYVSRQTAAQPKLLKQDRKPERTTYDYNADWFKLDDALDSLSIDENDPYFMPEHTMSIRVEKQLAKPKVNIGDLKFALDNPLKAASMKGDRQYAYTKFSQSKSTRQARQQARDENVNLFYQSSK